MSQERIDSIVGSAGVSAYLAVNSSKLSSSCPGDAPSPSLSAALLTLVLKLLHVAVADEAAYNPRGGENLLVGCDDLNKHEGCVRAAKRIRAVEDMEPKW